MRLVVLSMLLQARLQANRVALLLSLLALVMLVVT
jgi:hypothetical protein